MHKIIPKIKSKMKIQLLFAGLICLIGCLPQPALASTSATSCADVQFVFARGSGETLGDTSFAAWQSAISAELQGSTLKYNFYELGSQTHGGARYPAVAVAGSLGGFGNLLGAFVSAGQSFDFGESVLLGRNELKSYLRTTSALCPNTKFVLGGYSQGAMLISGILDELDASKIIYTATFGDPKLYLPEGQGARPDACYGKNLSNYRAYVSDCHAYEGVLGSYRPYQPGAYWNKLGLWCNGQDMMCSSGLSIDDHTAYSRLGLYQNAASVIASKLRQNYPTAFVLHSDNSATRVSPHDMVILLHGGGDMDGLILAQYKLAAKRLANQIYSLGGRVALYVYGDSNKWNLRQLCDFSCTAVEFEQQLSQITHRLSAVDYYNSALSSLYQSMSELNWQIGATKSAVLLTNQPYSRVDYNGCNLAQVAALSLKIDPVNIYPITSAQNAEAMQPLAQATNGKVYNIGALDSALTEISGRPVASLALETYAGVVGETFTFATNNPVQDVRYDWDLDADGVFELQDAPAVVQKTYTTPLSGYIQVRLTDRNGYSSTMSAQLQVTAKAQSTATISELQATPLSTTSYRLDFVANAEKVLVAINDTPIGQLDPARQASLIVNDVSAPTHVRLIPYEAQAGRGPAAEITLTPYSTENTPSNNPPASLPATQPSIIVSSASNTPAHAELSVQLSNIKHKKPIVFIPTVPNTGIKPKQP